MKKTGLLLIITVIIFAGLSEGCSDRKAEQKPVESGAVYDLMITRAQFEAMKMETGTPASGTFEETVRVNGLIVPKPGGKAKVSTMIPGTILNIVMAPGSYAEKGKLVCVLNSQEAVKMQQEFAETHSLLNKLNSDYQRVKTLMEEKIGAQKEYVAVESDYLAARSRYQALSSQLEMIGIHPIDVTDGKVTSRINIVAPISGYITYMNGVTGQYIEPQSVLFEMVDQEKLQLKLSVFAKDISNLTKGQKIRFYNPGNRLKSGMAELVSVGKSIDPETKTVDCYAEISGNSNNPFIDGEYVEAGVITAAREALALPTEAIQKSAGGNYIFIKQQEDKDAYYFVKKYVKTGLSNESITEIIEAAGLKEVLIKGTETLTNED